MKKDSGFTIIELLIVIAVIGVAAAVSMPSIVGWRSRQQLYSATRDLQDAIRFAQVGAIRNSTNAFLTGNENKAQYYTVSLDTNRSGAADSGDRVLRTGLLPAGVSLYDAGDDSVLTFTPRGVTTGNRAFSLKNENSDNPSYRRVSVNLVGRVLVQRSSCGGDGSWETVM